MPAEVEVQIYLYHTLMENTAMPTRTKVSKLLCHMGAKKEGTFLFQVMVFHSPLKNNDYLRVRNEGQRTTITLKQKSNTSQYVNEDEVEISDFQTGVNILKGLGATKKYFYEKIREIWTYKNLEIVFDEQPGLPTLMEIESKNGNEDDIFDLIKKLDINKDDITAITGAQLYKDLFGIELGNQVDLPHNEMKNTLSKLCTKNKKELTKIMNSQLKKYAKLIKKEKSKK